MSSEIKLLPCPFCGGEAKIKKVSDNPYGTNETFFYRVICIKGCCSTYERDNQKVPIKQWNTRKPMDSIVEQLEEAKERSNRHYNYGEETAYRHAIEIVKGGGIDG